MNPLTLRRRQKRKKPEFLRQNWFRFPSLGKKWRAAKGNQNKLRMHIKGKGFEPHPGYGSPALVRGSHPSGLKEIRVFNAKGLEGVDPKKYCIRIASSVGKKKKLEITKKAQELKIRVLNPAKVETAKTDEKIDKKEQQKEK